MSRPIINLEDVVVKPRPKAFAPDAETNGNFEMQSGSISNRIGAKKLGYNLTSVPPGNTAYPLHNHHVNEEMFLILEGKGKVKIGNTLYPIKPQDVIACPPGGPDTAHQIINTGDSELRYLAVSTLESPELVDYPDSGKFGVFAKRSDDKRFAYLGRGEEGLDYWDGE